MNDVRYPFGKIHYFFRRAAYLHWHRQESNRHILRSQLGFSDAPASRPKACQGCIHYHGIAYGQTQAARTALVCGFHPYGCSSDACPDWRSAI